MQHIIHLINTSGVYLRLHLGDTAFIRSPAFNRVNTVYATYATRLFRDFEALFIWSRVPSPELLWAPAVFFFTTKERLLAG